MIKAIILILHIKDMIWKLIEDFSKLIGVKPYLIVLLPGLWMFVSDIRLCKKRGELTNVNRYYLYSRLIAAIVGFVCIIIGLITGIL